MNCCFIFFHIFLKVFVLQVLIFAQMSTFFSRHCGKAHHSWLSYHMHVTCWCLALLVNGWMKWQLCVLKLRTSSLCGHHQNSASAFHKSSALPWHEQRQPDMKADPDCAEHWGLLHPTIEWLFRSHRSSVSLVNFFIPNVMVGFMCN